METETFISLLHNAAHWEFEIFGQILFDVVLGMIIWPPLKRLLICHKKDDNNIAELQREVRELKIQLNLMTNKQTIKEIPRHKFSFILFLKKFTPKKKDVAVETIT